jgi:hypothetical protein
MRTPVSLSVSSKTLKYKTKFSHILTDNSKRSYFIHRFCDEYSIAAAMGESYGQYATIYFILLFNVTLIYEWMQFTQVKT